EVSEAVTGWLAIRPTRMDFSWVNASQVEQHGSTAVVKDQEAPLWVGSRPVAQAPSVHRAQVKQGTQLSVLDKPWTSAGVTWLPVAPYEKEVRYIPESAVKPRQSVEPGIASALGEAARPSKTQGMPPGAGLPPGAGVPPGAGLPSGSYASSRIDQLLNLAEQPDLGGNVSDAITLSEQAARKSDVEQL